MSQKCEFQYNLLPFETIKEATQGDVDAVEEVLKHYDGYINNLSRRKMYDELNILMRQSRLSSLD